MADGAPAELSYDDTFRRYGPYVATVALRLLGSRAEADEIVQDVFLEAHRRWDRIEDRSAIKWWLTTVTIRTVSARLRSRKWKMAVGMYAEPEYEGLATNRASPERQAELRRVYEALDRMPVKQRMAWTLRHIQGEQLQDVAKLLGCSTATAKRQIGKAEARIREAVGHDA
ncbi:MAG: sigma-70 family RNA polymerase sigma factor [Myxococcota bacterium]